MLPKFTRVQTKEKVIVAYRDSSNWLHTSQGMCSGGSGVCKLLDVGDVGDVGSVETWARTGALGTIFLTNRRIIFESLDGDIVELHLHEDIKSTEGKDGKDVWAGWDHGLLRINKIDGNYVEYVLYCGKKFSDRANQILERVKAERARLERERMENEAYTKEEDLDNAGAIKIWESLGNRSEAKRIRLKMREEEKVKVDQTVVHGGRSNRCSRRLRR